MIDILQKIIDQVIPEEQAYDICDEIIHEFHSGKLHHEPMVELAFDEFEYTAFCFGLDLGVLANWRKNGWPTKCNRCGAKIDYKKYGWMIIDNKLVGVSCCQD